MERKQETKLEERRRVAPVRGIVAVGREFEQVARTGEMSITQYRFMLFLRNGPKRAGEIAATSLVTKATVSGQISALKDKGWIAAEGDAADRRVSRIILTPSGLSAMDSFERRLLQCLESLIEGGDKAGILQGLSALYLALGDTRESRLQEISVSEDTPA